MIEVIKILSKYDPETYTSGNIIYSKGQPSLTDLYAITLLGYVYDGSGQWVKYK